MQSEITQISSGTKCVSSDRRHNRILSPEDVFQTFNASMLQRPLFLRNVETLSCLIYLLFTGASSSFHRRLYKFLQLLVGEEGQVTHWAINVFPFSCVCLSSLLQGDWACPVRTVILQPPLFGAGMQKESLCAMLVACT